jgi:hypothetical protein
VTHLAALMIFAAISCVIWYTSIALYRSTIGGPDPAAAPGYRAVAAVAVGAVALTSLVPAPWGYLLNVAAWAAAAYGFLDLPPGRASVLVGYLAVASFASRLAVLGALELF